MKRKIDFKMSTLTQMWQDETNDRQDGIDYGRESSDARPFRRQVTSESRYNDNEEDDEDSLVDMTDDDLELFSQQYSEPSYDFDQTKDYASQQIDFSQEEIDHNYVHKPKPKRSRLSFGKTHYKDTKDTWYLEEKGAQGIRKIFYKNESFCFVQPVGDPEKIFTIQSVRINPITYEKMADCLVRVLIRKTFLAENFDDFQIKTFEEKFGKYACQRKSSRVKLRNLNYRFKATLPEPKLYYDAPPIKGDSKGVGWSVAYSFDKNFGTKETIVVDEPPSVIDLFAGAGGMSIGLKSAGFEISHAVDNNPEAEATLRMNHEKKTIVLGQTAQSFIKEMSDHMRDKKGVSAYEKTKNISHCHASTPCQGFGLANTTGNNTSKKKNNQLSLTFAEAMISLKMLTGTFENVSGMLQEKCLHYLQNIMALLILDNFQVRVCVLDSSDYGDAQKRKRVIMFVSKNPFTLPETPIPTHGDGKILRRTAKNAIGDLESIEPRDGPGLVALNDNSSLLVKHHIKTNRQYEKGEILVADKPAHTMMCSHVVGHYSLDRVCTNLEMARLQGFPDSWEFFGNEAAVRKQIGNAVPIGLATAVAKEMFKVYDIESLPIKN